MEGRKRKESTEPFDRNETAKRSLPDATDGLDSPSSSTPSLTARKSDRVTRHTRSSGDGIFPPGYFSHFLDMFDTKYPQEQDNTEPPTAGPRDLSTVTTPKHTIHDVVRSVMLLGNPGSLCHSCGHSQIGDENVLPSEATVSLPAPLFGSFMQRYWSLICETNISLELTSCAVQHAFSQCYKDQTDAAARVFSGRKLSCSEHAPCNSKVTMEDFQKLLRLSYTDGWERQIRFASFLPGFSRFGTAEGENLLRERRVEMYLIHRGVSIQNKVFRYGIGPNDDIHPCPYFLKKLNVPDTEEFVTAFVQKFNRIGLTDLERYVFLCVAVLRPDAESISSSNRVYVEFLYTHYMDLLRHLLNLRASAITPLCVQGELTDLLDQVRICSKASLRRYKSAIRTDN